MGSNTSKAFAHEVRLFMTRKAKKINEGCSAMGKNPRPPYKKDFLKRQGMKSQPNEMETSP
jgi:hypothetical protein